jgi:glycosyltransferase involved in cell wall biosynthesis
MTRFVFWQNILAFYQVPHISALAALPDHEVIWVVEELLTPDRVKAQIGLLTEPPYPVRSKVRNALIPTFHYLHRLAYGRRISFILAIGHMAVRFYRSVGYSDSTVFPYGYFPELIDPPTFSVHDSGPVSFMYLGQLIHRKGVDILLNALAELRDFDWRLNIMGNGDAQESLEQLADKLEIRSRLKFIPPAANEIALNTIAQNDVFVLPSRHDGWGAVINEALICGVPAISSDHCGAADLVRDDWRGSIFQNESIGDLAKVLLAWIKRGQRTEAQTKAIQSWSELIGAKCVSRYLSDVAKYTSKKDNRQDQKPQAPWLS